MRLCPESLKTICDYTVSKPSLSAAARALGITPRTIFNWIARSAKGDPLTILRYPDDDSEPMQFKDALALARKMSVVLWESQIRSELMDGIPRIVIEGGRILYEEDERIINAGDAHRSPEELMILWGQPDVHLRKNGTRVPRVVYDPSPAHTKIHALKSLIPSVYGEKKTLDVNSRISGGVMVMSGEKPREIPREAPMRQIEHVPAAEFSEVPAEPVPAAEDPRCQDQPGDSNLVRDLKRQLREGVKTPRPNYTVDIGRTSDEPKHEPARPAENRIKLV